MGRSSVLEIWSTIFFMDTELAMLDKIAHSTVLDVASSHVCRRDDCFSYKWIWAMPLSLRGFLWPCKWWYQAIHWAVADLSNTLARNWLFHKAPSVMLRHRALVPRAWGGLFHVREHYAITSQRTPGACALRFDLTAPGLRLDRPGDDVLPSRNISHDIKSYQLNHHTVFSTIYWKISSDIYKITDFNLRFYILCGRKIYIRVHSVNEC